MTSLPYTDNTRIGRGDVQLEPDPGRSTSTWGCARKLVVETDAGLRPQSHSTSVDVRSSRERRSLRQRSSAGRGGPAPPPVAADQRARGIAMITTLLVMMLMSALLVGFTAVVMSDQRFRFIDRDRGQAFYAASGGVEKLTADLGNLFFANVSPKAAQIAALTGEQAGDCRRDLYTGATAPTGLPACSLSRPLRAVAEDDQDCRRQRLHDSCSAPTPTGDPVVATTSPGEERTVRRADRGTDALSTRCHRPHRRRRRDASRPHDGGGRDPGVPVRHVLRRRPGVFRRPQLHVRRAVSTPTATCFCRRAAARR